jgi:hypothetical protein
VRLRCQVNEIGWQGTTQPQDHVCCEYPWHADKTCCPKIMVVLLLLLLLQTSNGVWVKPAWEQLALRCALCGWRQHTSWASTTSG